MTWGRQERTLSGEPLASLALGSRAAPVGIAGGLEPGTALRVWGTFVLGFSLATVAAQVVSRAHKPGEDRALLHLAGLAASGPGVADALLWTMSTGVSPWRVVARLPTALVALGTFVLLLTPRHLDQLGWSFAAAGLAIAVLLGVGLT